MTRDLDQPNGNLLFGGIDTAKFSTPTLASLPLNLSSLANGQYAVNWTSYDLQLGTNYLSDVSVANFSHLLPISTLFFTFQGDSWVPPPIYQNLVTRFGAYDTAYMGPCIPCSVLSLPGRLQFGFGSSTAAKINVPFSPYWEHVYSPERVQDLHLWVLGQ